MIGLGLLVSCNNDEFSTGAQFFNGISFGITTWDTLTLKISTVKFDSVATSSATRLLIGEINHPEYGQLVASTYVQVTPDSSSYKLVERNNMYDSITLVLTYDNYYLGDTLTEYTLRVFEVTEEMDNDDENGYFYNTTDFATTSEAIGSKTVALTQPVGSGTIEITLNNEVGSKFYNEALKNENAFSNTTEFLNFFKGIKIVSAESTSSILGFKTSAEVRIYYTDNQVIPSVERYLSFSNQSSGEVFFNHFNSDYSGTVLQSLSDENNEILSSESDEQAYMQSGAGLGIRIEIPYLRSILESNPNLLLDNVTLKLRPINNQYPSDEELPEELYVYYVDKNNQLINSEYYTMQLTLDEELDIDTYYSMDISDFFNTQLNLEENNNNALFISSSEEAYGSSAHYLTIGDQENKDYRAQINLNLIQLK